MCDGLFSPEEHLWIEETKHDYNGKVGKWVRKGLGKEGRLKVEGLDLKRV